MIEQELPAPIITERAERDLHPLKTPEGKYPVPQEILEALPYSAVIIDETGDFCQANSSFRTLSEDLECFTDISAQMVNMLEATQKDGQQGEAEVPAGGVWHSVKTLPLKRNAGPAYALILIENIAGKKAAEERRQKDIEEHIQGARHDLKQPLTTIQGYAQWADRLLKKPVPDIEGAKKAMGIVDQVCKQETARISLTLAAGRDFEKLNFQRVNLTNFLQEAAETIKTTLPKSVILKSCFPEELAEARIDPQALLSVLYNLVDNSVYFMHKKGKIIIWRERTCDQAAIYVHDTGVGIPPENFEKIFEPYFSTRDQKGYGNGMGLPKSRKIMRVHGGNLKVYTSEPGKGTTMVFYLPLIYSK